ncbi:hypothetical protein IC617_02835 [Neiella sp. HB171785]|uniref:Pectate lyase superfamily protein domain-containing protein n=1 Tax=Neiella litorisoli TaxID=2771431 RepID=A0A8J6UID4_9GAMM|nr:hypothetical protein [Neiella litorisoli]MBD1388353.1 hypothetical protein [Neiella litorisoli]
MIGCQTKHTYFAPTKRCNQALFAVALMACTSQIPFHAVAQADGSWVIVDQANIEKSRIYMERGVGYFTYNDIVIADDSLLAEQLRLVVTDNTHTVLNADGVDANEQPYFNVESLSDRNKIYFEPKRISFSYSLELQQFVEPQLPGAFELSYDFDSAADIQTENNNWEGWVYPTANRGVMAFEAGAGEDGAGAYSFVDTSSNSTASQHGLRFNNRTNQANINPWFDVLAFAQGKTIHKTSVKVRVEKATPGDVTVYHNLIPYPLIDGTKGEQISAGIAAGPQYSAVIPAADNGTWVDIEFVDSNSGSTEFTIPYSWAHYDGNSEIQVYPQFTFGGLEQGDKVYIDDYLLTGADVMLDGSVGDASGNTGEDQEAPSTSNPVAEGEFSYNFNVNQIQTENNNWEGWVYPTQNRGVMAFVEGVGEDGSAVMSYQDTSTNTNIAQNGVRFNNRTNKDNINPWTDFLADVVGTTLNSVSLWVKVEKATAGNVTVRHNLVPYPLIDDTKGKQITAGIAVGPEYEMVIPASANNTWVQVEFVDSKTGQRQFTIPDTWKHFDGTSPIQVYPQFLFDGLDVGDKVYFDNYLIANEPLLDPCCEPVEDDGGNTGGGSGGSGGNDSSAQTSTLTGATGANGAFNLGDQLTFTYNFDVNETTASQGDQGWIYSVIDRGAMAFEDAGGQQGSALSYTDTSINVNPEQNGVLLQDWSGNPFTAMFMNHGHTIKTVSLWVKTELVAEKDIEIIHYLIPYGLVAGNKSVNYPAGIAASPKLVGTIPAGSSDWVKVDFVVEGSEAIDFTIPSTWFHVNAGDELQIYPEFKFANTEVGDKIYIDEYRATSVVGEPLPIPTDFSVEYDFENTQIAQNGGWGYIANGFGTYLYEDGTGYQGSKAVSFTDTSAGTFIGNHSLLWHKWGTSNPWSGALAGGNIDTEVRKVTLKVKIDKAAGNLGTEAVTIKHHLLPWNIGGSNKFDKVAAAQAVTADYTATVSADRFGEWVEVTFVDANTGSEVFVIPDTWKLTSGGDIVDVLPAFFFGGLEVGDKIIIDDYLLIGDNEFARTVVPDEPAHDYGFHDGSGTYTETDRPEPLPVVDSDFYVEPASFAVVKDLVTDLGFTPSGADDTAAMQAAIDTISNMLATAESGKLIVPAGDYYVRSLKFKSNVHMEMAEGAVFHIAAGGGYNVWMFEMGNGNDGKVENFSFVGQGNGFTIDLTDAPNIRTAVFKMGDIENFKFSNFKIADRKSIFASFLVGITERDNDIFWPVNGIIEKIDQSNSLFGYGLVQMYGADNILFRDLHSEGGITLRMETDNLTMKDYGKGGIRDIFAEDIRGTDCLAPVMFGPHFQENGSVQVNGVTANGCGFAVRVDDGFVELFSPAGESYTRNGWKDKVNELYGDNCSAQPYARGTNQWAARINPTKACLDAVHQATGLKPGWFAESYIYNVTANNGSNAHLKQNQLNYFADTNPACENVCIAAESQWDKPGQIYMGPSLGGVYDLNEPGVDYHFNINVMNLDMVNFPSTNLPRVDAHTRTAKVCPYYVADGASECSDARWNYQDSPE